MLVIRLFRVGKKNQPSFKIVVADKKNPPRGGRFVEEVGFYNPLTKEKVVKKERVQYWLSQGVQLSDTVHNLLVKEGILQGKKIPVHKKSKKPAQSPPSIEVGKSAPAEAAASKPAEIKKEESPKEQETQESPKSEVSPKPAEKVIEVQPQSLKLEEPKKE